MFSSVAGGNFFHPTVSFMPKGASAESPFLFLFWLLTPRFRNVRLLFSPWACFFCVFLQPPSITAVSRCWLRGGLGETGVRGPGTSLHRGCWRPPPSILMNRA